MEGKLYYTIGEVADMMDATTSQLRYWSGEFNINLRKNRKGDRLFQNDDIVKLKQIQSMLKDEGYTIDGAKKQLKGGVKPAAFVEEISIQNPIQQDNREEVISKLKSIKASLITLKSDIDTL